MHALDPTCDFITQSLDNALIFLLGYSDINNSNQLYNLINFLYDKNTRFYTI